MKNKELYEKTVNILVDAYFNDTLEHGNQCGCAVGNIIAANMGIKLAKLTPKHASTIKPVEFYNEVEPDIGIVHYKNNGSWWHAISFGTVCEDRIDETIEEHIRSTGYSAYELSKIERAFELQRFSGNSVDENMFNGLMAVVEMLDQIHENTDQEVTKVSKQRFVKQPA